VAAMKVYGGAIDMKYDKPCASQMAHSGFADHESALRYALGLSGVSLAVLGIYNEAELLKNIEWLQRYAPLAESEEADLLAQGKTLAEQWGPHYGSVE
jgi:predicted aldo/keto reductase-like oxidoreductase